MQALKAYVFNTQDDHEVLMQTALWIAMLSVIMERMDTFWDAVQYGPDFVTFTLGVMAVTLITYLWKPLRHVSVILFALGLLVVTFDHWALQANHSWLAAWTLVPAALFSTWWKDIHYLLYLRITLGAVMIAAGMQKLVTGTYLDGSYITYLSHFGSPTEQVFRFLCDNSALLEPCVWHQGLGIAIVVWQFLVGFLLLFGPAGVWVILIEVAFLLSAGFYADEMNFQTLNIAVLTIAFGYGMFRWLALFCIGLLIVDAIGIGEIFRFILLNI